MNDCAPVLALLGVLACFFIHVPCGPYSATNGPASDARGKSLVQLFIGTLLALNTGLPLIKDAATSPFVFGTAITPLVQATVPLRC
jgi:hypothetical protein